MRVIDLIELFQKQHPQADFPPSFHAYLEQQERLGHPIRRATTGQPLKEFLSDLGVPGETSAGLLDADSRLALRLSFPALLQHAPDRLAAFLAHHLATVFSLQETVLDSETLTGFNRHGREHLRSVTHRIQMLLKQREGEVSVQTEREAILAGYLHDIGNLISRKEHGIYGLYLLTQLLTEVDADAETLASFMHIMEAVLFHEVEFGSRVPFLGDLRPVTLSLIVADKTDISFKRVSSKSNVPAAIWDAHMLVNLLTGDSRIRPKNTCLEWEIHFTPKMQTGDTTPFSALLKRSERVWVPSEWQKLYRTANIEYVFIFQATFLRVYFSRLSFAIRAVFALKPSLDTFRLVIYDDERGVSLSRVFRRDDYEAKIQLIANNLFKNLATPAPETGHSLD